MARKVEQMVQGTELGEPAGEPPQRAAQESLAGTSGLPEASLLLLILPTTLG